ncbi:ankyrin repeat-containing domain protein [Sordaria brevicollis]|uniref:Ankyrin repeat-containing domain protein n=1 Tax=Sordaria brevicollis TaxID=83679 RepID=A0AAE0PGW1_SORBR|nr:ankyrin repeat-containing domain protein [Sordaria brevicollis]
MPSISALPTELVVIILEDLDCLTDVAALAQINKRLYDIVNPILYKRAVSREFPYPLEWAAHHGVVGTLLKALDSGADPNFEFQQCTLTSVWESQLSGKRELHPGWDAASVSDSSSTLLAGSNGTGGVQSGTDDEDETMTDWSDGSSEFTDHEEPTTHGGNIQQPHPMPGRKFHDSAFGRRYTALHLAARAGHVDVINILLDRGARSHVVAKEFCLCWREVGILNAMENTDPDYQPSPGWTPLHVAICHSQEHAAIKLLDRGAPLQMELPPPWENSGFLENPATAIHHAAAKGLTAVIRYLVDARLLSDIDVRDNKTLTPFYYAYAYRRWDSTVPLLLRLGANINVDIDMFLPYSTITPLGEACRTGCYEEADMLISFGADVNRGYIAQSVNKGLTPLHMCAMPPAKGLRDHMLWDDNLFQEHRQRFHVKVPAEEYESQVQFGQACTATIEKLVARGAALEMKDCPGNTPLMAAVQNLNMPAIKALLKAGANNHVTDSLGRNLLMQAIDGPQGPSQSAPAIDVKLLARVFRELLHHGASITHYDNQGNTLLHVVCGSTRFSTKSRLQRATLRLVLDMIPGAASILHVRETRGNLTPLMVAFMEGNLGCCDVLVRRGAWYNSRPPTHLQVLPYEVAQKKSDLRTMFNSLPVYKAPTFLDRPEETTCPQLDFLRDLDVDGYLLE